MRAYGLAVRNAIISDILEKCILRSSQFPRDELTANGTPSPNSVYDLDDIFDVISAEFRLPIQQSSKVRSYFRFSFSHSLRSQIEFIFTETVASNMDVILC
jgi:hypothetical protein